MLGFTQGRPWQHAVHTPWINTPCGMMVSWPLRSVLSSFGIKPWLVCKEFSCGVRAAKGCVYPGLMNTGDCSIGRNQGLQDSPGGPFLLYVAPCQPPQQPVFLAGEMRSFCNCSAPSKGYCIGSKDLPGSQGHVTGS